MKGGDAVELGHAKRSCHSKKMVQLESRLHDLEQALQGKKAASDDTNSADAKGCEEPRVSHERPLN